MSKIQVDTIVNSGDTGAPNFPKGVTVSGVATATTFVGNLTGNVTGNVTGNLTGTASTASTADALSTNATGTNLTLSGNLTVNGTTTTIDTVNLLIEDKNIGIGSTSTPSNLTADGAGITIFGGNDGDKTLTWEYENGCFEYNQPNKFKGVTETVSAATTYMNGSAMVLEMDVRQATTYTYTIPTGANIGIVSFKNISAQTNSPSGTAITLITTQNAAGTGNTTATTGIGTNCTVIGYENGAAVAGISTRALVGSGTTITLSTTGSDENFVSFFIRYTGGTNTSASSYKVYVVSSDGFRQGAIGV